MSADLLDLTFPSENKQAKQEDPADLASLLTAPAAATTPAAPTLTPPPVATNSLATATATASADDDWDGFQSAPPTQPVQQPPPVAVVSPPVTATTAPATMDLSGLVAMDTTQPVVTATTAAPAAPAAATTAAPAGGDPTDAVLNFDPLSNQEKKGVSELDLAGLGTQTSPSKGTDNNLISFGAMDEFDPVAQKWAKEEAGQEDEFAILAPSASASAPAPAPAAASAPAQVQAAAPAPVAAAAPAPAPTPATVIETGEAYAPAVIENATPTKEPDLLGLDGAVSSDAPEASGLASQLEDVDKITIYVYHKGEKNVVSWYAEMKPIDIKEAVLCACDAIMDGGFVLREVEFSGDDESSAEPKEDGRLFAYEQFDELKHGQTYIIESAKEREDLKSITGDRWRRLKVQVEPLLHVEAQKAIERMRKGSNLLKHTHYGFPHLRQFQLSDDRKRLVWYSGAKRREDSVVQLHDVTEIRLGQTTPTFLHYRLPMLEHLSFSLVYGAKGNKTLDVTCKDEFEFDLWVTGLKAIFYHIKNRQISKEQLLGHSKRFKKALEKNNANIKLTKLPEVKEKGHVGLDDCIEIVTHTPQQLDAKMERLRERLRTMSQQVARLDHHSTAEMEVDLSLLTGQGPAYASVFKQDEDAQDEEMEIRRMHELVEQTTQLLLQARNELIALNQTPTSDSAGSQGQEGPSAKKRTQVCKQIDQYLWKAEVDLENVEDMYLRHMDNQRDTMSPFFADINSRLSRAASDVEETFKSLFR